MVESSFDMLPPWKFSRQRLGRRIVAERKPPLLGNPEIHEKGPGSEPTQALMSQERSRIYMCGRVVNRKFTLARIALSVKFGRLT